MVAVLCDKNTIQCVIKEFVLTLLINKVLHKCLGTNLHSYITATGPISGCQGVWGLPQKKFLVFVDVKLNFC